jgi:hypothetical protein
MGWVETTAFTKSASVAWIAGQYMLATAASAAIAIRFHRGLKYIRGTPFIPAIVPAIVDPEDLQDVSMHPCRDRLASVKVCTVYCIAQRTFNRNLD